MQERETQHHNEQIKLNNGNFMGHNGSCTNQTDEEDVQDVVEDGKEKL